MRVNRYIAGWSILHTRLTDSDATNAAVLQPEAAVYCTASVEAFCDALFAAIVTNAHEEAAAGVAPLVRPTVFSWPSCPVPTTAQSLSLLQDTKVTVHHIQVALRSHVDFAQLLARVDSAALVLECFLDAATSRALYARQLLTTPDAKHLRPVASPSKSTDGDSVTSDDELIRLHERTRAEWQKREDDPFADVDFATVLKCAHPAFTLSYNATALLSALVRELLNSVCDLAPIDAVQRRVPPELYLEDIEAPIARVFHVGDTGDHIARTARDCLERFRLRSRKGSTLTIRFSVLSGAFLVPPAPFALTNVPRDTLFTQLLLMMCKKCHADAPATMAVVYRGRQVELQTTTPARLSMPTGGVLFLVPKKWWDYTRRNEARRGLLSSLRPQDAQLKSLVQGTESKVKRELQGAAAATALATAAAASPTSLYRLKAPRRDKDRRAKQPLNNASPGRLHARVHVDDNGGGHPSPTIPAVRRPRKGRPHSKNEAPSHLLSSTLPVEDDDSLSLLLNERTNSGRPVRERRDEQLPLLGSSRSTSSMRDNHGSDDALAVLQQRHALTRCSSTFDRCGTSQSASSLPLPGAVGTNLAAHNAQLLSTLDAAWVGFAAISGGARSMDAKLSKWRHSYRADDRADAVADPSATDLADLERELLARLEKTDELVAQTLAAKQLMTQLVEQVQGQQQQPRDRK